MIFHLGTQWLTFMAILQGSESVNKRQDLLKGNVIGRRPTTKKASETDAVWLSG